MIAKDERLLRIGVLGCGAIAQITHLDACRKARNAELYAICDRAELLRERMSEIHQPKVAYDDYDAMLADDEAGMLMNMGKMTRLLDQGTDHERIWGELTRAILNKAKVAAREWRRLTDLQQCIPAERVAALFTGLAMSIRQNVTDPVALRNISEAMARLTGAVGRPRAEVVDGDEDAAGFCRP